MKVIKWTFLKHSNVTVAKGRESYCEHQTDLQLSTRRGSQHNFLCINILSLKKLQVKSDLFNANMYLEIRNRVIWMASVMGNIFLNVIRYRFTL